MEVLQKTGVVSHHVRDDMSVKDVVEEAEARAKGIYQKIRQFQLLPGVESVLSLIINETVEEFERIRDELHLIQEKVVNRTKPAFVQTLPATMAQLKEISYCLKQNERKIELIGMIAKLDAGLQSCRVDVRGEFTTVLMELYTQSEDLQPVKSFLCQVYRMHLLNVDDRWIKEIDSLKKLATGIAFYEANQSICKDSQKAARYFNSALKEGNSEAYYYFGMLYRSGNGVQKCNITAFEYFKRGTHAKDPKSMAQLSVCYLFGEGVELSDSLGVVYAKMSAEAGDPYGMFRRASHRLYGTLTNRNLSVALHYTKKALEKGSTKAKMHLANFCFYGLATEQDAPRAIQLWTECVEAGGYACILDLAHCYEHGLGVDVDLQRAAELYRTGSEIAYDSCRRKFTQAFYGMCLVRGRGVEQDLKKGWSLIRGSVL